MTMNCKVVGTFIFASRIATETVACALVTTGNFLGTLACYDLLNALRDPEAAITSHENMCTWLILERKQHADNTAELQLQIEGPKDKVLEIFNAVNDSNEYSSEYQLEYQ